MLFSKKPGFPGQITYTKHRMCLHTPTLEHSDTPEGDDITKANWGHVKRTQEPAQGDSN